MEPAIVTRGLRKVYRVFRKEPGLTGAIRGLFHRRYHEAVAVDGVNLEIGHGELVGFLGPNGAGKTTLVRALLGDLQPDAGELKVSPQIKVGYFRQTQEHIDPMLTVWEYLQRVIASNEGGLRASEQQARNLAGAFLFSGPEQEKCVGNLSGGERGRMVIAGIVSAANNLIVLDEPTNHRQSRVRCLRHQESAGDHNMRREALDHG